MRQRLVRSTVLAVVLSVIIVGLPLFLAASYGVAARRRSVPAVVAERAAATPASRSC